MLLVLIYVLLCTWLFITFKTHLEIHDSIPFYNGSGIIDHVNSERDEQIIADTYIDSDDNVLELGTRYGTVSCLLARKANRVVSLDPDLEALNIAKENMKRHGVYFDCVHGIISLKPQTLTLDDYSSTTDVAETSDIPNYTIEQIERKFNIKFNTLVADCEGCLEHVVNENDLSSFYKITYEKDQPHKCNYQEISSKLQSMGFKLVHDKFHVVWIK